MTFRYGGYYRFKVIYLENKVGDPHFLFYSMISFGILNHFHDLNKILSLDLTRRNAAIRPPVEIEPAPDIYTYLIIGN